MKYKPTILLCNHKGNGEPESQMEYCGNGDYVCPVCGDSYHDDDFDRGDDDSERLSAYDAALIWQSKIARIGALRLREQKVKNESL